MPISYRPARAQDLERADALTVASINDLTERHGFGPMAAASPPLFQLFSLQDDPDGLWVAAEGEDILGFAFSWRCGDLWFLAQLFVSPDHQGHRIGHELLGRAFAAAEKVESANRALITFAFNRVSQALYIRHGMFPRMPIYAMNVARESLIGRLAKPPLRAVPLQDTAAHQHSLAAIDARALGVTREKHHRYLLGDSAMRGFILCDGEDAAGYAYVGATGHVGPLAVARPDVLEAAFTTALSLAAERGSARVSALVPGTAAPALGLAVALGMQITFPMLLMSSREFGDWACYLPRNPGFM